MLASSLQVPQEVFMVRPDLDVLTPLLPTFHWLEFNHRIPHAREIGKYSPLLEVTSQQQLYILEGEHETLLNSGSLPPHWHLF